MSQLNNWHPKHLTLTRLERNCYEWVTRVWHLISFTAEISHHFCTFVVQSRADVECCSFFFAAVKSYLGKVYVRS